jgi:hypothetical protein
MNKQEWFKLGLRLFGVWGLINAVADWVNIFLILTNNFTPQRMTLNGYIILAIANILVGFFLVIQAPNITSLVFKNKKENTNVN